MTKHQPIDNPRIREWRCRVTRWLQLARFDPRFRYARVAATCHDPTDLVRQGWRAVHAEQYDAADKSFRAAIHLDPFTVSAWIGLSKTAATQAERRDMLQIALDLHLLIHEDQLRHGETVAH